MKTQLITAALVVATTFSASAVTLVELDFSGSGAASTIGSADSQFTVINSAVTFDASGVPFTANGGALSTGGWNYDGTGTALANNDLFTGSNFGSPTRLDFDLGQAATGETYTITSVEIDIRASNRPGTNWEFMYRDTSSANQILAGGAIPTQSGTDPIGTYSINIGGAGLTATDSSTDWLVGNGLRFAFYEADGAGPSDNLQIDAIRIIGTSSVPEPSAYALIGGLFALSSVMVRRRR